MKRLTLILFACLIGSFAFAEVTIDKENCTITKDGKTFKLQGDIRIVNRQPDITVQLVKDYADIDVKIVRNTPFCCEVRIVDNCPDVCVQIVEQYADITVKIVDNNPCINSTSKVIKK